MERVARALWEVLSIFGVPKVIQSDNCSEFVNYLTKELTTLNSINHRTISSHNPKANGAIERVNGTVNTMFLKGVDGATHRWEEDIPYIKLAYNCKLAALTA